MPEEKGTFSTCGTGRMPCRSYTVYQPFFSFLSLQESERKGTQDLSPPVLYKSTVCRRWENMSFENFLNVRLLLKYSGPPPKSRVEHSMAMCKIVREVH